jgi:glycerophosphoryl diester phosphodiesterase
VFVQCFDANELRRVRHELGCELPLIQLLGPEVEYAELVSEGGMRAIATYANGIGPHHSQLVALSNGTARVLPSVQWARDAGLAVHPYTFRADELPPYVRSLDELLELFFEGIGVDGVFCDHPDVAVNVRNRFPARER